MQDANIGFKKNFKTRNEFTVATRGAVEKHIANVFDNHVVDAMIVVSTIDEGISLCIVGSPEGITEGVQSMIEDGLPTWHQKLRTGLWMALTCFN